MKKLSTTQKGSATGEFAQALKELLISSFSPFWWIRFLTLSIILSFSIGFASAQKADSLISDSSRALYCSYMEKSRSNFKVGMMLLIPGTTAITIAAINDNPHKGIFYGIGGIVLLGSLQAFISSADNKKKARLSLKIKTEKVGVGDINVGASRYTGPALKLEFK
ncbi:MAG TPA: hypothetical protein VGN20_04150 [Mucilaginibacter sp.]|jgi:hypothetical protein